MIHKTNCSCLVKPRTPANLVASRPLHNENSQRLQGGLPFSRAIRCMPPLLGAKEPTASSRAIPRTLPMRLLSWRWLCLEHATSTISSVDAAIENVAWSAARIFLFWDTQGGLL